MTFPGPTSPFPLPFIKTDFPLFLAPMAGVTDPIFRTICKELGADVMVTEFVSAEGILQAWERNRRYTKIEESHRPIGIQLFGADGAHMGEAARIILDHEKPDFIDINFGCPVPKVVGKNGGSSLLKDLPLLASVAAGVVKAVGDRIPVTAKIRIGWDFQNLCAMDACRLLEDAGISMITIHGRTRSQQYSGAANWDIIDECVLGIDEGFSDDAEQDDGGANEARGGEAFAEEEEGEHRRQRRHDRPRGHGEPVDLCGY